jgi:C-terminal processing protease CtpA/Prc
MKNYLLALLFAFPFISTQAQPSDSHNLDFEQWSTTEEAPDSWYEWGSGYLLVKDSVVKHHGNYALKISPEKSVTDDDFGGIGKQIPISTKAKKITLSAWIKMEGVTGSCGLVLNLLKESESLVFDNMSERKITGTSDWKRYEVTLPYDASTDVLSIGPILVGGGTMWVDELEITLDGKPLSKVRQTKATKYPAEKDTAFSTSSTISFPKTNPFLQQQLYLTGLIWGYMKYHHPAVQAGNYNWDAELFRMLPTVMATTNQKELERVLLQWINKLGTYAKQKKSDEDKRKYAINADLHWIETEFTLPELRRALSDLQQAERPDRSYYVGFVPNVGNPDFKHEIPYAFMKYTDGGYRLLTLYRFWNMVQYYFPYRDIIGEDWKKILKEFIPKYVGVKGELEYYLLTKQLICQVHDSHAGMSTTNKTWSSYWGKNHPGLETRYVEDKLVVSRVVSLDGSTAAALRRGDIIHSIDGKLESQIRKEKLLYIHGSNYPTQLRNLTYAILRTNKPNLALTIERDGEKLEIEVPAKPLEEVYELLKEEPKPVFTLLKDSIAYLNLDYITMKDISNVMQQACTAKGIIIDIRNYPDAFCLFQVGNYLMPNPTPMVSWSRVNPDRPGAFYIQEGQTIGEKNKNYYQGPVMILINEETQSMAEYTTMALRVAPRAKVLGSTTAGADGNISMIDLPGGIRTLFSGIGVYYPDGKGTQRIGIVPDIQVLPTVNGIRDGRDEVLERALVEIRK